jgi:putative selenate reductase molybdopterin-binding subunit
MELELRINGVIESLDIAPSEGLLSLLRREGHCSVKRGCETGECGACTILVDGVPRPSCVMLAGQVGGCTLTTVEGLSTAGKLHPLQTTFMEMGATPCGFCTPGMLLSAYNLLKRNPLPTADEVRDALSGNLCRCSGYEKPVQAVLRAAAILRGEQVSAIEYPVVMAQDAQDISNIQRGNLLSTLASAAVSASGATTKMPALGLALDHKLQSSVQKQANANTPDGADRNKNRIQFQAIGKSLPTRNALKMVQGRGTFVADMQMRNMLYARILTSPHAHAVVRSIETSRARALPGVYAVLTYKDVPRIAYTSVERNSVNPQKCIQDQYSLDYHLRYVGDRVAIVAAETPEIAAQALKLIDVEYEVLPALLDVRQGLAVNTPCLHPETESRGIYDVTRNIAARVHEEVGSVEDGFAQADLVVEGEYVVSPSQSAPLENHVVIAYFDENDFLIVCTNSQVPHFVRRTLARLTGLPLKHIRVVTPEVGGSFGVKHELMGEDLVALLSIITQRPVILETSRAEELSSRIRAQHILRVKTGVKRDGTIVASQMALLADTGAHGTHPFIDRSVDGKLVLPFSKALAAYPAPHMQFVAEVLYTNHPPAAACVGNGEIQAFFALESHMDEIAHCLDMDALELRRRNVIVAGAAYPFSRDEASSRNAPPFIENNGLTECMRLIEEKLQWYYKQSLHKDSGSGRLRRGIGLALTLRGYSSAPLSSGAILKMNEDGSFDIFVDVHDGGLGATTMLTQIVAEVLGVPVDDVLIHTSEIEMVPFAGGSKGANGLTAVIGAVQRTAEQARRQILTAAGRMLNVLPETLRIRDGNVVGTNGEPTGQDYQPLPLSRVAEHTLFVEHRQIMVTASWKVQHTPTACAVQGVEVEVDMETGHVRVLKVVSAVDVGTAINPMLVESQIHGYIVQGLSLALSEELLYDANGALLTSNLRDYRIFAAPDKVEMQALLVETTTSAGVFSINAVAEVVVAGIVPAIANAIADATGVRLRHAPFGPERVLRALHAHAQTQAQAQEQGLPVV